MAFKMKGSAFKLGNVATKSALKQTSTPSPMKIVPSYKTKYSKVHDPSGNIMEDNLTDEQVLEGSNFGNVSIEEQEVLDKSGNAEVVDYTWGIKDAIKTSDKGMDVDLMKRFKGEDLKSAAAKFRELGKIGEDEYQDMINTANTQLEGSDDHPMYKIPSVDIEKTKKIASGKGMTYEEYMQDIKDKESESRRNIMQKE
jgi:predicted DNA binding CopG/RHH family protein